MELQPWCLPSSTRSSESCDPARLDHWWRPLPGPCQASERGLEVKGDSQSVEEGLVSTLDQPISIKPLNLLFWTPCSFPSTHDLHLPQTATFRKPFGSKCSFNLKTFRNHVIGTFNQIAPHSFLCLLIVPVDSKPSKEESGLGVFGIS